MPNIYTLPDFSKYNERARIVDLGCNIGYESLKLWNIYNPEILISVDPFEYNIVKTKELIEKTVPSYCGGIRQPVFWVTEQCAISCKNGEAIMSYKVSENTNNSPCGGITVDGKKYAEDNVFETVKTKRLSEICSEPNILKVDIEGHEWYIWDQLLNTESVKIIFLELHATHTLSCEDMKNKLQELKRVYSLRWFKYAQAQKLDMDDAEETDESIFDCQGYCHVLCERKASA